MAEAFAALDVNQDYLAWRGEGFLKPDNEAVHLRDRQGDMLRMQGGLNTSCGVMREGTAEIGDAVAATTVGELGGAAP